jgi:hypothetical protein
VDLSLPRRSSAMAVDGCEDVAEELLEPVVVVLQLLVS